MAERSAIEWTDATFNPWIGCTKVSPGCDNCYAAQQDGFRKWTPLGWGAGMPRKRTSAANWREPVKWNAREFVECTGCGHRAERDGNVMCPACGALTCKPARRRVFCSSLADVFDNEVDPQWRADLFALILNTPNLDWLLLTKRIGNARSMLGALRHPADPDLSILDLMPLPNVWVGATVVNQQEADRDIPRLLATPARVRFLSMEPLIGPVNLWLPTRKWKNSAGTETCDHCCNGDRCDDPTHYERGRPEWQVRCPHCRGTGRGRLVDWVIVGGESGPKARPTHPDWVRGLRDQCAAARVPLLMKQWGEFIPESQQDRSPAFPDIVADGAHGCPANGWPASRVHEWPDGSQSYRCGKKAAGRLLDGVSHNAFPEVTS